MENDLYRQSDCVYYDVELKELSKHFDAIYKIFKDIRKRAERCQTVQINKSLFDFYQRKDTLKVSPQEYYDFRLDDVRICIFRYHGFYSVLVTGIDILELDYRAEWIGKGKLYGKFNTYVQAVPMYIDLVCQFVMKFLAKYSSEDIPF